ncbi:MAG: DUF721 domain-containing protein [Gemmatimonadota bacterium]
MNKRRKKLEPLADALTAYLAESGIAEAVERRRVFGEWRERVGDRIAKVAVPLRLVGGTLIVGVRSSAWLMELKLMEKQLLDRVNRGEERNRIDAIRLVMGDADEPTEAGGARRRGRTRDG